MLTDYTGGNFPQKIEKFCILLLSIQAFILFIYLFAKQLTEGTPVLLWDQYGYYQEAVKFYQEFSFVSLKNVIRPLFSLPSLLFIRSLRVPLNPVILIVSNAIIYQAILLGSILWIVKLLGFNRIIALTTISILWATPQFYDLISDLWGDIPLTAWVFLYTALLIFIRVSNFSIIGSLLLGIVGGLGLQIKPIFIFYGVISTCIFYVATLPELWHKIRDQSFLLGFIASILVSLIGFFTIVLYTFPIKLPKLIKDLTYNNEVLGYWQGHEGIFNTWLWFINEFGKNFSIPVVLIIVGVTIGIITLNCNQWLRSFQSGFNWSSLRFDPFFSLIVTFLVSWVYISFFVRSKDIRTVFFLFAIFILIGVVSGEKLATKLQLKPIFFIISVTIVIGLNTLLMISWTSPNPVLSQITQNFDLKGKNIFVNKPVVQASDTYESLGIAQAINFLDAQSKNGINQVFISHNSWRYNDALFRSYKQVHKSVMSKSAVPELGFYISSAPFNKGGWGVDGGIPASFFASDFVIIVPEHKYGAFNNPTIEVYNFLIAEALAKKDPVFTDGLVKLYEQKNEIDETIIIYKRDRLPSKENFVTIVEKLATADKNNLFNVPFIYAALQLNPQQLELRTQLLEMAKPEFLQSVSYRFVKTEKEVKVKSLLASYPNSIFNEFFYPDILKN